MPTPTLSSRRRTAARHACACVLACCAVAPLWAAEGETEPAPAAVLACPDYTLGPVMPPAPDRSQAPIIVHAQRLEAGQPAARRKLRQRARWRFQHGRTDCADMVRARAAAAARHVDETTLGKLADDRSVGDPHERCGIRNGVGVGL